MLFIIPNSISNSGSDPDPNPIFSYPKPAKKKNHFQNPEHDRVSPLSPSPPPAAAEAKSDAGPLARASAPSSALHPSPSTPFSLPLRPHRRRRGGARRRRRRPRRRAVASRKELLLSTAQPIRCVSFSPIDSTPFDLTIPNFVRVLVVASLLV